MSNQFYWFPTKIKFRFELTFYQMILTKHEIISVLRITNWNYTLVKIFIISHYSWQLALFPLEQSELSALREGDASAHQLLLEADPMKSPLVAEKHLVECVKHILNNDSSDSCIPVANKYHDSIIRSIPLDGNIILYQWPC